MKKCLVCEDPIASGRYRAKYCLDCGILINRVQSKLKLPAEDCIKYLKKNGYHPKKVVRQDMLDRTAKKYRTYLKR